MTRPQLDAPVIPDAEQYARDAVAEGRPVVATSVVAALLAELDGARAMTVLAVQARGATS